MLFEYKLTSHPAALRWQQGELYRQEYSMNEAYYFRTSDPDQIRHAPSHLERVSKAFPAVVTQQESEHERQCLIHLLDTLNGRVPGCDVIAQKLRECRNDLPCRSPVCPHCRRERILAHLAMWPCTAGEFSRIRGSGPVFQQGYANFAAMEEHRCAQGANWSLQAEDKPGT